jgi:hypothetical protein
MVMLAAVVAAVVAPAAAVGVCVVVPHAESTMATNTIILTSLKVRIYFLLQICSTSNYYDQRARSEIAWGGLLPRFDNSQEFYL